MTTAESCTGGLIASMLTRIAGSSDGFHAGFVTYANDIKQAVLDVPQDDLDTHGAVSEQVVKAMALGAWKSRGPITPLRFPALPVPGAAAQTSR